MGPCCSCMRRRKKSPRRERAISRGPSRPEPLTAKASCGHAESKLSAHPAPASPTSSVLTEYHDALESFAIGLADGCSPRHSISSDKHVEQQAPREPSAYIPPIPESSDAVVFAAANIAAPGAQAPQQPWRQPPSGAAPDSICKPAEPGGEADVPELLNCESYQLAGTSESSEEPWRHAAQGGPMARLASCLTILDNIRLPLPGSSPPAPPVLGAGGAEPSSLAHRGGAGPAGGSGTAGGGSRRGARRMAAKLEPGSTLRRRDYSTSILDVREAWDECADAAPTTTAATAGDGPAGAPSTSGRPFMVRGRDYARSKLKVPSGPAIYQLAAADVFTTETKVIHVARRLNLAALQQQQQDKQQGQEGGGPVVHADPQLPPLLIINIMLPMYPATLFGGTDGASQNLCYCFRLPPGFNPAAFENQTALALLRRFVTNGREADGTPTRDRLKLIPRVVNVDEWAQKGPLSPAEHRLLASYNDKPILTRPQHHFFTGPGYLEVDIDIHAYQFLARKAFGAYFNRLQEVIFENAFVVQGNAPEELPEQILGAVRLYRLDLMAPRPLKDFLARAAAGGGAPGAAGPLAGCTSGDAAGVAGDWEDARP